MKLLIAIFKLPFNWIVLFGRYIERVDHDVKMYLKRKKRGG